MKSPDNWVRLTSDLSVSDGAVLPGLCYLTTNSTRFQVRLLHVGLHGAKVAIMGRRQQVIQDSAQKLQSEGFEAVGVQVGFAASLSCASADVVTALKPSRPSAY